MKKSQEHERHRESTSRHRESTRMWWCIVLEAETMHLVGSFSSAYNTVGIARVESGCRKSESTERNHYSGEGVHRPTRQAENTQRQ